MSQERLMVERDEALAELLDLRDAISSESSSVADSIARVRGMRRERDEALAEVERLRGVLMENTLIGPCVHGQDPFTRCDDCGGSAQACLEGWRAEVERLRAEMEKERGIDWHAECLKWAENFPDHCYRCEMKCKYAGEDRSNGAMRCGTCLLADERAEVERLRAALTGER